MIFVVIGRLHDKVVRFLKKNSFIYQSQQHMGTAYFPLFYVSN